jgi:hypothetical protein
VCRFSRGLPALNPGYQHSNPSVLFEHGLSGKPASTSDQVLGRLLPDHALALRPIACFVSSPALAKPDVFRLRLFLHFPDAERLDRIGEIETGEE